MSEKCLEYHKMWFRSKENYLIICPKCNIFNHVDRAEVTKEGEIVPDFVCFSCKETTKIKLVK
jgi:hypothetical protein